MEDDSSLTSGASTIAPPVPMTGCDVAIALIHADLASGKSTKRSLGIMYAHVMAGTRGHETEPYREVNTAIIAVHDFKYLDGVKKIGWDLYEAASDIRKTAVNGAAAVQPKVRQSHAI